MTVEVCVKVGVSLAVGETEGVAVSEGDEVNVAVVEAVEPGVDVRVDVGIGVQVRVDVALGCAVAVLVGVAVGFNTEMTAPDFGRPANCKFPYSLVPLKPPAFRMP